MIEMEEKRREIGPYDFINYFMSRAAHVVSRDKRGHLNVMALLWKTIGELWMIPVITIAVAPSRYTFTLLNEGVQEFTLNIPSKRNAEKITITGSLSGRNADKFKKANLETIEGKRTKVPTIKGSILSYECKIVHSCKSGNMAPHHLFFGQILTTYASNELHKSSFDENL